MAARALREGGGRRCPLFATCFLFLPATCCDGSDHPDKAAIGQNRGDGNKFLLLTLLLEIATDGFVLH
jgi:hypothetical protein